MGPGAFSRVPSCWIRQREDVWSILYKEAIFRAESHASAFLLVGIRVGHGNVTWFCLTLAKGRLTEMHKYKLGGVGISYSHSEIRVILCLDLVTRSYGTCQGVDSE